MNLKLSRHDRIHFSLPEAVLLDIIYKILQMNIQTACTLWV